MKKIADFKQGNILKMKSDNEDFGVTKYHVDEIFVGKTRGEVIYRISFKERHSNHPKAHLTDGWGFELAPEKTEV